MEFEKICNRNQKEWKDLNAKMRKELKNAKAIHGLNSKKWKRRKIGIRPNMALLLRPKYILVNKNRRESSKTERRRREEKKRREGKEEEEGRGVQERFKGMDSRMDLWIFVWNFV